MDSIAARLGKMSLTLALVFASGIVGTADGGKTSGAGGISPGFDLFETDPEATVFRFQGDLAIPAGFFAPGSEPFTGSLRFGGTPIERFNDKPAGDTDTVVRRMEPLSLSGPGSSDTVPIELVQLSLVSMAPITVRYSNGSKESWDVQAALSPSRPSTGSMTVDRTSTGGGTFDSRFTVYPVFTFKRLSDGAKKTLDVGALPLSPTQRQKITFHASDTPWADECVPPALPIEGVNDDFCASLTPEDEKTLTAEQALSAQHGIRPVQPMVEHFKCYRVVPRNQLRPRTVRLRDQFGVERARVVRPIDLCNPVQKNDEELQNTVAHLKCYAIQDLRGPPAFRPQHVLVRNQFGPARLRVRQPSTLCVPTTKRRNPRRPPPRPNPDEMTDHFKCYEVQQQTRFKAQRVRLRDQFGIERARAVKPVRLCAPVRKNNERVQHPVRHLVCYEISERQRFDPRTVATRNQFGIEVLNVIAPRTLCVPSLKLAVKKRPPPPPGDGDGDGIPDGFDRCPAQPAPESDDGCPPKSTSQCSDGADNDGDGLVDFPNDPGCAAAEDNDEFDPPPFKGQCSGGFNRVGPARVQWAIQCSDAIDRFMIILSGPREISNATPPPSGPTCAVATTNTANDTYDCTGTVPPNTTTQGQFDTNPPPADGMGTLRAFQGSAHADFPMPGPP